MKQDPLERLSDHPYQGSKQKPEYVISKPTMFTTHAPLREGDDPPAHVEVDYTFFYRQLDFHLSLELLTKFWKSLKIA